MIEKHITLVCPDCGESRRGELSDTITKETTIVQLCDKCLKKLEEDCFIL